MKKARSKTKRNVISVETNGGARVDYLIRMFESKRQAGGSPADGGLNDLDALPLARGRVRREGGGP